MRWGWHGASEAPMSTIDPSSLVNWDLVVQPADTLLTAADLSAFPTELSSGPVDYELDNGRLVLIMAPPGDLHGAAQSNIVAYLKFWGEHKNLGRARTETGLILWRNPDRVVTPDVMFAANRSLPIRTSPEGYWETIPDLVVEVRSKNDTPASMRRKVDHYLKAGVELVWVVDPTTTAVTVHTSAGAETYGAGDALSLPGLLPEFSLSVADVFRD
jgi:Uma2 family endonuclease